MLFRTAILIGIALSVPSLATGQPAAADAADDTAADDEPRADGLHIEDDREYRANELMYENEVAGNIPLLQVGVGVGLADVSLADGDRDRGGLLGGAAKVRVDLGVIVPYLDLFASGLSATPWYGGRAGIVLGFRSSLPLKRLISISSDGLRETHTYEVVHARRTPALYGLALGASTFAARGGLMTDAGGEVDLDTVVALEAALALVSGQYDVMVGPVVELGGDRVGLRGASGLSYPVGRLSVFARADFTYLGRDDEPGLALVGMFAVGMGSGMGVDFRAPAAD